LVNPIRIRLKVEIFREARKVLLLEVLGPGSGRRLLMTW